MRAFIVAASMVVVCAPLMASGEVPVDAGVSVLCIEAGQGTVLFEHEADTVRPPASMVKMMLMLLVTEGVKNGDWTLEQTITASGNAELMGGSQVYLKEGETHTLDQLMHAVAVKSANDAAMAVAEGLWGDAPGYLRRANERAAELGMSRTTFRSVHGLPPSDGEEFDQTTARDMAVLASRCLEHSIIRNWTSTREFVFREQEGTLFNTNKLLWRMEGCDGMKTGYIRAAGFCVTATAVRNDIRLISVIMGHPSNYQRFNLAEQVVDYCFGEVQRERLVSKGIETDAVVEITNGEKESIALAADADVWVTVPTKDLDRVRIAVDAPETLAAPIEAGAAVGEIRAELDGRVLSRAQLVAPETIEAAGWMSRIQERIRTFAGGGS